MKIMIVGGHERVALLTAPLLVKGGHHVTSVIRHPEHAPDVAATGATVLVRDVETLDEVQTRELLAGNEAVVWMAALGDGRVDSTYAAARDAAIRTIDAAVAERVGRFVMVSYAGSERDRAPEASPLHANAQESFSVHEYLRRTSLDWTIAAPGQLTDDMRTGRIGYGYHVGVGDTSRGNVAELVAGVVGRTDLGGVTIRFRDGRTSVWEAMESLARRASGHPVALAREGHRLISAPPRLAALGAR